MSSVSDEQKLVWFKSEFRPHFDEWVIAPAARMIAIKEGMPTFVWLACAIDWLAGFWYGKPTNNRVREAYTGFIKLYFPPHQYDADGLYDSLRNGLVHMYTIKYGRYALTHQHPEMHLRPNQEGYQLLNLEDFFQDVVLAKNNYFDAVEADVELLEWAIERIARDGFLKLVPVNLL